MATATLRHHLWIKVPDTGGYCENSGCLSAYDGVAAFQAPYDPAGRACGGPVEDVANPQLRSPGVNRTVTQSFFE